jgi:hypothetical protein
MGLRPTHSYENQGAIGRCTMSGAWDGEGCVHSGESEAVTEFDLERAF